MRKTKKWSDLNSAELAEATRVFDNPDFDPPARKPTKRQAAALRSVQNRSAKDRFRVSIALESDLIEKVDVLAAKQGITFSELVSDALKKAVHKKSA